MNLFGKRGRRVAAAVVTAGSLGAFQALALIGAPAASAVSTCAFNPLTHTVAVTMDSGDTVTMTVDGTTGAIELGGSACGSATISNTTSIVVLGTPSTDETLVIDNNHDVSFPASIAWAIDLGTGTGDALEIHLEDGVDGSVTVGDSAFTMNGAPGQMFGVEDVNVYGGDGDDTIDGSALTATGPSFSAGGGDGDDTITGGAGDDSLYGDAGDDWLAGGAGDDEVHGNAGADTVYEGAAVNGADVLSGGSNAGDTIDYGDRVTDVALVAGGGAVSGENLDAATDCEAGETDEEMDDVDGFDTYITGSGDDCIVGTVADETFVPGEGDDSVDGKGGTDTLDYSSSLAGVTIDPAAGTTTGQGDDEFADIEEFVGSDFNDTMIWDGSSVFYGGDGRDTVDASAMTTGVTIDLSGGALFPGQDVENAIGGSGDDTITGNDFRNSLWGGPGHDMIDGGLSNDTLNGGPGPDVLDGEEGADLVSYRSETGGVTVNLALGTGSAPSGDDALSNIESVIGSPFNDNITGSEDSNLIKALRGRDSVRAGGGPDTVRLGPGNDSARGGSGDDNLFGGNGNDRLFGGSGDDLGAGGRGKDICKSIEIKRSCGTAKHPKRALGTAAAKLLARLG